MDFHLTLLLICLCCQGLTVNLSKYERFCSRACCRCGLDACLSAQQKGQVTNGSIPSMPLIPLLPSIPIEVRHKTKVQRLGCLACVRLG